VVGYGFAKGIGHVENDGFQVEFGQGVAHDQVKIVAGILVRVVEIGDVDEGNPADGGRRLAPGRLRRHNLSRKGDHPQQEREPGETGELPGQMHPYSFFSNCRSHHSRHWMKVG
jgi:hypothetical protein